MDDSGNDEAAGGCDIRRRLPTAFDRDRQCFIVLDLARGAMGYCGAGMPIDAHSSLAGP